jgi:DNA-binding MarR family transcriptional regulator
VINQQLLGLSTGMDTLGRLLANALISERTDPTDKRARLIQATPKGREVLERCYAVAQKVNSIVLSEMTDDDIRLCIQLLRGAEARTSALVAELRDKSLDEVYEQVVGEREERAGVNAY